jgi:EmrB/QacA subfamily drug resistance transporter
MPGTESYTPRQKNLALITMIVAVVLEIVDLTIINTALPAIKADFGAGAEAVQWIVAGYSLSFALLLMTGGRLGDSYGYRKMFLLGVTGFTLASLGCGLAESANQLVFARLMQGATGAIMAPQFMALMQVLFDPLERVSKLALFGLIGGISSIVGPILGGLLIEANLFDLGWRLVFLINLPVGLMAIVSGWFFLPETKSAHPSGFDLTGTVLFGLAVLGLLWPLTRVEAGWRWAEWSCLIVALPLIIIGWRHVARRVAARLPALFDPSLFRVTTFRLGLGIAVAFAAANSGFLLTFAFALQTERGQTPLMTGLLHMPFGFGAMIGIAVLGRNFLPRYGKWVLGIGGLVMAASALLLLAGISLWRLDWIALVPLLVICGTGMGTLSGCINPVAVSSVERNHAGAASALLKTAQQVGAALGVALAGSIYFAWTFTQIAAPSIATVGAVAVLLVVCTILAMMLPADIFRAAQSRSAH